MTGPSGWRATAPAETDVETVSERLDWLALIGRPVAVLEPPPLLADLWARAQADGLPISRLYVIGEPLEPYARGAYNRRTGEAWVLLQNGADMAAAESLVHELAHAQRQQPPATSIDDDWDEEAEVYLTARRLAERWGHPELLPDERLAQLVSECWDLAEDASIAGQLAGTQEPWLARVALVSVRDALAEQGLGGLRLSQVLWDRDGPAEARRAAILFPRHELRGRWSLPFRPDGSLGALALDATERALDVLWHTLAGLGEHPPAVYLVSVGLGEPGGRGRARRPVRHRRPGAAQRARPDVRPRRGAAGAACLPSAIRPRVLDGLRRRRRPPGRAVVPPRGFLRAQDPVGARLGPGHTGTRLRPHGGSGVPGVPAHLGPPARRPSRTPRARHPGLPPGGAARPLRGTAAVADRVQGGRCPGHPPVVAP